MPVKVDVFSSLEDARDVWSEFQHGGRSYVFQTFEWLSNWFEHVGRIRAVEPCLVSVRSRSGAPLVFFPFQVEKTKTMTVLEWLGDDLIDYGAPIVCASLGRDEAAVIWNEVAARLPRVDLIRLVKIPQRVAEFLNPVVALDCHRYRTRAHHVAISGSWDEFYQRHAGAKTRSTDRRKRRRLEKLGAISYAMTDGGDLETYAAITGAMIEQKSRRYREISARDILAGQPYRKFFAEPNRELLTSGILHVSCLRVDEEIVTTHWGMVHDGRLYYYMPSFSGGPSSKYSPGRQLLFYLFQWCLENGIDIFDFTIGDESYKDDWCDEQMLLYEFVSGRTWVGKCYGVYDTAKRLALGIPPLRSAARAARRFSYRIRYRARY
jgi:CelD/BcsL family acetyltransferase involved in cellulose biosynthesis